MTNTPMLRFKHSLSAAVAALVLAACADTTLVAADKGPDDSTPPSLNTAALAGPELGSCDNLQPPTGATLGLRVYARGVQTYRWNGQAWAPAGPKAELFADAGEHATIGTHYAGPYWESLNGSKVKGAVLDKCTVDANAIDWLALSATPEGARGVFSRVVFIQRVNTVGGKAPTSSGSLGEVTEVPYS